jgi:hypothetical protein
MGLVGGLHDLAAIKVIFSPCRNIRALCRVAQVDGDMEEPSMGFNPMVQEFIA